MAKQSHSYKSREDKPSAKLQEPFVAYVFVNIRDSYLNIVSEETFRHAITKAVSDFEKGMVMSHDKIDEFVKTRMGWRLFGHTWQQKGFFL